MKDKPESTTKAQAASYQAMAAKALPLSTDPVGSTEPNFQSASAVRNPVNGPDHFEQISPAEISKLTGGGQKK